MVKRKKKKTCVTWTNICVLKLENTDGKVWVPSKQSSGGNNHTTCGKREQLTTISRKYVFSNSNFHIKILNVFGSKQKKRTK